MRTDACVQTRRDQGWDDVSGLIHLSARIALGIASNTWRLTT